MNNTENLVITEGIEEFEAAFDAFNNALMLAMEDVDTLMKTPGFGGLEISDALENLRNNANKMATNWNEIYREFKDSIEESRTKLNEYNAQMVGTLTDNR